MIRNGKEVTTQAIYIERKWLQCSASCRGEKKKKLGIKSPWAIYTNVEKNMLLRRKYQISIGRWQVRITQNRGSQKGFLRHLDGNFMLHKIVDSLYCSLLDKHLREYRATLCLGRKNLAQQALSWSQLWRRCHSGIKYMRWESEEGYVHVRAYECFDKV